jgi:hypothetical protein
MPQISADTLPRATFTGLLREQNCQLLAAELHEWSVGEAVMPASPRQSPGVAYAGREAWLIRGLDAATAPARGS